MTEAGRSHGAPEQLLSCRSPRPSSPSSPYSPYSPYSADRTTNSTMTNRGNSVQVDELDARRRLSIDTGSSEYDYLSRSPLFEHENQPGPSGLPRIRQQSKVQPRALSLPVTTPSSASVTPCPSSASSAGGSNLPSTTASPGLEDLHRFPSESLHSFSFAQPSEELLHSRYNVLKRSINFMKDRGWVPAMDTARVGEADVQGLADMFSRADMAGAVTGPAHVTDENIFDRAFADHSTFPPSHASHQVKGGPNEDGAPDSQFSDPDEELSGRSLNSTPISRRASLKRTYTDIGTSAAQNKLMDALSQPYSASGLMTPGTYFGTATPAVHTHSSKWSPVPQAVFRTEAKPRWTILAANDLACLVFGITQKEFRKLSVLDLIEKERQPWLEARLTEMPYEEEQEKPKPSSRFANMGNGVTAQLLSKPPAREKLARRAKTGDGYERPKARKGRHAPTKSRGVLLCGDVVPIRKRNGSTGSASLWVMDKRGGLIWVVEEIVENTATMEFDTEGRLSKSQGDVQQIWGRPSFSQGTSIFDILPNVPHAANTASPDFRAIIKARYFTARTAGRMDVPVAVEACSSPYDLRISSFPHIAGMMVLSANTMDIISANPVFSAALFGQAHPEGSPITQFIPDFDTFLSILTDEDNIPLVDGMVIPENSFRRARALSILREGKAHVATLFSHPTGLPARHSDGGQIMVDVQLRIVRSESFFSTGQMPTVGENEEFHQGNNKVPSSVTEVVFALWVTYSRHLHSAHDSVPRQISERKLLPRSSLPEDLPVQRTIPSDGANVIAEDDSDSLSKQLNEAASEPLTDKPAEPVPEVITKEVVSKKKTISDYVTIEDMGQGAYGQVKLVRSKADPNKKLVLKYVTKKRILVDTWTRDRQLGTVPLEIHILHYLRREHLQHPNIIDMEGFFEDDINYYIEMTPHGFPGMDLFDYVELKAHMEEDEVRSIFRQVVSAIDHLHTKALVAHRDIKDENVILDGEGRIKLIDFGSAAYLRSGPFDVFVGTIDYAAPEVLQGKPYYGKEQDVWALGILLYTIIYKENPFYDINEIMDHPLRVPFLPFSDSCINLIRGMLNREVSKRLTITDIVDHPWMRGFATMDDPTDGGGSD